MNIDGTGRKRLTFGTSYDGQPAVAPDGKTIAFISERDGPSKVYLMNRDGSKVRRLTQGTFNDSIPVFARDGSKIFFVRRLSAYPNAVRDDELFSIDIDGANEERLTRNRFMDASVAQGRDNKMLYYLSDNGTNQFDLMKLDLRSGASQRVLALGLRGNTGCDISPDEQWVAYISDREQPYEYEVFVSQIDGSERRKLTNFHGYIEQVRFAPDSKQVIFVVEPKGASAHGQGDIYIAPLDGTQLRKIGAN
jgi:TolB protein